MLALGRLGWSLRRIQPTTGVRRETVSAYRKQVGIAVRDPRTRSPPKPASPRSVSTDPSSPLPARADPVSNRRTRLFVFTLGYSRKSVRLLCFKSPSRTWAQLHEHAFRRLGGAVRVVVLDNLSEGVLPPELYDPQLNPLYRDVLAHYGVAAMPCRVRDPDRKGKVESAVGHAQKTPLKGLRVETLEQAQAYLDRWEQRWADTRIHGTAKRQVAAMFEEERPHLLPLPLAPFRYYQHGVRTEHLDGCAEVEAAYYQSPPGLIGRQVGVQWDGTLVRIVEPKTGELLREYLRQRRGGRIVRPEDLPKRTPIKHLKLLGAAHKAGPSVGALCDRMYRQDGEAAVRRIQGGLSLGRTRFITQREDVLFLGPPRTGKSHLAQSAGPCGDSTGPPRAVPRSPPTAGGLGEAQLLNQRKEYTTKESSS